MVCRDANEIKIPFFVFAFRDIPSLRAHFLAFTEVLQNRPYLWLQSLWLRLLQLKLRAYFLNLGGTAPSDLEVSGTTEERMPSEQKWYALPGRVVYTKVEADGDIHIALQDTNGDGVGTVSAEIQLGQSGGRFGKLCLAGLSQKFPVNVKTAHTLKIREPHVITVIGKAFYDIGHAPADHSNRRHSPKDYAVQKWRVEFGPNKRKATRKRPSICQWKTKQCLFVK